MEELWGSPDFIAEQFQIWYHRNSAIIPAPIEIEKREFAFITFHSKGMHRHIALPTETEMHRYLRNNAPMHAYHSSSYYANPTSDMSQKGWLGADLVFDIDADHFNLPCQREHDRWWCRNCDQQGTGHPPEICSCGRAQFTTEAWLCEKCLHAAKFETQKLLDILITDFGVKIENLITNFSGNRGYHVHVHSDEFKPLDQNSRREIVDYIMATGLEAEYQGFSRRNRGTRSTLAEDGWRGRTGRAIYDYLSTASEAEVRALKLGRNSTLNIINSKDIILNTLVTKHPSNVIPLIDPKSLEILLAQAAKLQASEIDTVVTTDIHRLIRMPNTLHGKTGWQVQTIPYGQLPNYDPLKKAVIIRGDPVELEFRHAPKIKIHDKWYGPYEEEEADAALGGRVILSMQTRSQNNKMRTRYTRLHTAWENEIKREELQNIPDDFLHEMKNYTTQLNKTSANTGTLSGNLTQTERKYANQMLKELTEIRLDKILRSEINGLPINAQAMTPEEQKLHSNIRQLLTGYRQGAELPTAKPSKQESTPTVTKREPMPEPPKIEEKETELMLVRFLQSLPAIMGIDMKAYGPFQPEELVTIPRQNAENLIKRGIAKKVETDA